MQYFFVFQNKTFEFEKNGGYIWAPKTNASSRRVPHWDLMRQVEMGDVIIHSYRKRIEAISRATSNCYPSIQPDELKREHLWDDDGWRVDCQYVTIRQPIITSEHMDVLLQSQPQKHAPFNCAGRGNTGYLFSVTQALAAYVWVESCKRNPYLLDVQYLKDTLPE